MSRPNYAVKSQYLGTGAVSAYTFNFKIISKDQLLITAVDVDDEVVFSVDGNDTTYLSSVVFTEAGGTVTLAANLPAGHKLAILFADDQPVQPLKYSLDYQFTNKMIENALDRIVGPIQKLFYWFSRVPKISDEWLGTFDGNIPKPTEGGILGFTADGTAFKAYEQGEFEGPPGPQGNALFTGNGDPNVTPPVGPAPNDGDKYVDSTTGAIWSYDLGGTIWVDTGDILNLGGAAITGFSTRYNEFVNLLNTQEIADYIFQIGYSAPVVTFTSAGSATIYEKGASVTAGTLTAVITKTSDDITGVEFFRNGVSIHTVAVPNPSGGTETYTDSNPFTDSTTFRVDVADGTSTVQRTVSYTFVYPYYVGAGAAGLSAAAVSGLTKRVITSTANRTETITAGASQVFYFAYPASYGALTSILDVNNFETIGDWTLRTENITGLDGNPVSYRIYEFDNPVVAGSYQYTFKR